MMRVEAHSQHLISQQHEEYAHKQQAQFQQFDIALKDKDLMVQHLTQKLANQKEQSLAELEQAIQDAERRAQQVCPVLADGLSTQPYATLVRPDFFAEKMPGPRCQKIAPFLDGICQTAFEPNMVNIEGAKGNL